MVTLQMMPLEVAELFHQSSRDVNGMMNVVTQPHVSTLFAEIRAHVVQMLDVILLIIDQCVPVCQVITETLKLNAK